LIAFKKADRPMAAGLVDRVKHHFVTVGARDTEVPFARNRPRR
jgi:hypothetical protein